MIKFNKNLKVCLLAFFVLAVQAAMAGIKVTGAKVEMLTNPVGIDCAVPRFSWEIVSSQKNVMQTGYRILVASSEGALKKNVGDVWDSGEKTSDVSNYIDFAGAPMVSQKRYFWKVQVKTNRGTSWSAPAFWQMGLLHSSDWTARWIGRNDPSDVLKDHSKVRARYLRKDFSTDGAVKKATLYISGLGLYEAYINGQRIGKQELAPGPTDYNFSVKYNTFDVTSQVKQGRNAIGVILGNGRFTTMRGGSILHFGMPQLLAQLEITLANGQKEVIVSDPTWKITVDGPIGNNNEYDGEAYDARKEMPGWNESGFNDASWQQAEEVAAPKGKLNAQMNPNIMIMDQVKPVSIKELKPGVYVMDMGQNMVGWLRMKVKGAKGDELKLHFAETLQKDGSLYTANLRSAETTDTYILKGEGTEVWEPSFTYHGFRYVEMTGFKTKPSLADIEGEVLYDEMATTGKLETSNAVFNQVYKNSYWGIRGNYRGMPTDCPQRDERMGWLGDRGVGCLGESYIFNNHLLYAKWLDDIEDDQKPDGEISDVSPIYWGVYADDVTWPAVWFTGANMLYDQFGDKNPIIRHYPAMVRWMNHIKNDISKDYIVQKDQYGDWCMPPESPELIHSKDPARITDGKLLSTSFYYMLCGLMSKFAALSGHTDDVAMWNDLAAKTKEAFNQNFFHADKECYSNNTVTANILPLRFGMVPEQYRAGVFRNIVDKTTGEFKSHVSAGLIGVQQLMRGLTDNGRGDLAWTIVTNKTYPSWGYMADHGATTIWELWNGDTADPSMNSGNHVMLLGDLVVWAYSYLGGIAQNEGSVAFKQIKLKPYPVNGLNFVNAGYRSVYGEIESHWQKQGGKFLWDFAIPCNTTAQVYIPVKNGQLDDASRLAVEKQQGRFQQMDGDYAVFSFGSGHYHVAVNQ
jgi:alpha-L-rhamnosidase